MSKNSIFKQLLFSILLVLFLSTFFGCDLNSSNSSSNKTDDTDEISMPKITISTKSIQFVETQSNSGSSSQVVTISNSGDGALSISPIEITGNNSTDFSISNDTCSDSSLSQNDSCSFTAVFSPLTTGQKSSEITVSSNDPDTPHAVISLQGEGTQSIVQTPAVSLSTSSIAFADAEIITESTSEIVTVSNTGDAPLLISNISITGSNTTDFSTSDNNCLDATLSITESCTFTAVFSPLTTGQKSSEITVSSNDPDTPHAVISLQGEGTQSIVQTPAVSLSTSSIAFADAEIITESTSEIVTVSNTGDAPLLISNISITGSNTTDFSTSDNNCLDATLSITESCTFTAVFSPLTTGQKSSEITVSSNDPDTPHAVISLQGKGIETVIVTFDDNTLANDSHYGGAGSGMGNFSSNSVIFPHLADDYAWSGFTYSNETDMTTAGYTNQFSVYDTSGYDGSSNFCISYVMLDWMGGTYDPIPNIISFDNEVSVSGAYFTNTTYAVLSMLSGDSFAKQFGGTSGNDEDWFLLTITGKDSSGTETGSIDFYLADYRFADNTNDYIIDDWTWVDLSSLGSVSSIEFILTSSDSGDYGMNTPAYFAMDNVTIVK
mgnify:CR=1 FL=1